MEVTYGLGSDFVFTEAVDYLKSKLTMTSDEYKKLGDDCKSKAFTVSGYSSTEILQTFLDTLSKAAEEGQTKEQFREKMNTFLTENGYDAMNPWKADTIFRTNIQTAFNVGHYESMTNDTTIKLRPYWQYETAADGNVREAHAIMHGRVYPANDPIWDIWYPPNGFRCRCMVKSLTKRQVEQRGLRIENDLPYDIDKDTGEILPSFPDKGFSRNPAKKDWKPDLSGITKDLKDIYLQQRYKAPKQLK